MIAACPTCSTRYRVENERLRPEGLRLRCTHCQAVFRVRAPAPPAEPTPAAAAPERPSAPATVPPPPPAPVAPPPDRWVEAQSTPVPRPVDRSRLVLIADSEVESAKELSAILAGWGLDPILAHDGVEAILTIQRALPAAVVLDAALPKMFGFQVCELVKRNAELRSTKVVLVGAIHHRDRYRRPPQEIYGADAYLERPDLIQGLPAVLQDFGLPITRPQPTPAPAPPKPSFAGDPQGAPAAAAPVQPIAPPPPVRVEAPPVPAPPTDDGLAEERAKAARLARIIVSDVILYNQEKFQRAVAQGNVREAMDADLEEGRALFRQRIDPRVRDEHPYLDEELVRVARARGAK